MFKIGDRVKCINALMSGGHLIEGNSYVVIHVRNTVTNSAIIMVKGELGHNAMFLFSRFEPCVSIKEVW